MHDGARGADVGQEIPRRYHRPKIACARQRGNEVFAALLGIEALHRGFGLRLRIHVQGKDLREGFTCHTQIGGNVVRRVMMQDEHAPKFFPAYDGGGQ